LIRLTHQKGSTTYADYQWTYDQLNRITQFISLDGTSNYSYNDRDELMGTDSTYQSDEQYSYDANGNRTSTGYETGGNNQLLSDGTYRYEYDDEGNRNRRINLQTGEITEYQWDYRNRLIAVITKDNTDSVTKTVVYKYDAFDRRISKTISATGISWSDQFVYDSENIVLSFDGNGIETHRYLHGPLVDQVLADEGANGEIGWALSDNQRTVRDIISSDGSLLNHIRYDSFGQVSEKTNSTYSFLYGYTGREIDEETDLNFYRARYYDSSIGRFITQDPIGFNAGDTNLYRYVNNNPINLIDPLGLGNRLVWQIREQTLSNGSSVTTYGVDENSNNTTVQVYRPKGSLFPSGVKIGVNKNQPKLGNLSIIKDKTEAFIEFVPGPAKTTNPKVGPWGGLYSPLKNGKIEVEARGHIVPANLDGANGAQYNFMSQNRSVNSGGYREFGGKIRKYLDKLGGDWQWDRKIKSNCGCDPLSKKPPSVLLKIDLVREKNKSVKGYPFRPDKIKAYAKFSDGKIMTGIFENYPYSKSKGGYSIVD
jgi:RHS repeat-associated protein